MNVEEAKNLAIELMDKYTLRYSVYRPWRLVINNTLHQMGGTSYKHRTITLSQVFIELNTVEVIRDTILHEIAHVLVGPGHRHDKVWKHQARLVGARPRACHAVVGLFKYRLGCPECGVFEWRNRQVRRKKIFCGDCRAQGKLIQPIWHQGRFVIDVSKMLKVA